MTAEAKLKTAIDALLKEATAGGEDAIPGIAVVITRKGGNVYEGSAGAMDLSAGKPFTPDTIAWIASMTKAMTSVTALKCVEQGLIGIDDDVSPLVPELRDIKLIDRTAPGFESGDYTLTSAKEKITLRRLLTHSNGLIYGHVYPHGATYATKNNIPRVSAATRDVFKFPSFHEAGQEWHYGMGIDYAGLVVEALLKDRLGHIFQKYIRGPLGMTSTVFNLTPALLERKATMYERLENGKAVPRKDEWPTKVEMDMGGGGSWSTASDYAKFVRMLLSDGKTPSGEEILKPETLKMGMTGHLEPLAKASCNEFHKLPGTVLSRFPGAKRDYGLIGMVFEEELPTGRSAGSIQWSGVANCHWVVDTKKDIGLVMVAQILPNGDPHVQKLLRAVETTAFEILTA